jgi:hypothetical protein
LNEKRVLQVAESTEEEMQLLELSAPGVVRPRASAPLITRNRPAISRQARSSKVHGRSKKPLTSQVLLFHMKRLAGAVGIGLTTVLKGRKLLISLKEKSAKTS